MTQPELDESDRREWPAILEKLVAGVPLALHEERVRRRVEAYDEARQRWQHYGAIPQKDWEALSGRHRRQLAEMAQRYGVPRGPKGEMDLRSLVPWVYDRLPRLAGPAVPDEGDPLMSGGTSANLERYRGHKADLAAIEVEERRRNLLPRDEVRQNNMRLAAHYRRAAEQMGREGFGRAVELMEEAEREYEAELRRTYGAEGAGDE